MKAALLSLPFLALVVRGHNALTLNKHKLPAEFTYGCGTSAYQVCHA